MGSTSCTISYIETNNNNKIIIIMIIITLKILFKNDHKTAYVVSRVKMISSFDLKE